MDYNVIIVPLFGILSVVLTQLLSGRVSAKAKANADNAEAEHLQAETDKLRTEITSTLRAQLLGELERMKARMLEQTAEIDRLRNMTLEQQKTIIALRLELSETIMRNERQIKDMKKLIAELEKKANRE